MIVLAFLIGVAAGSVVTAAVAVAVHHCKIGEHQTRRTWLTHTDVRGICIESDHNLRLARRWSRALAVAETIYRDQVGDLLDRIARLEARLRPQHRASPGPWVDYGRR